MTIESRHWNPQDLLDDLQELIDAEPDEYLNDRRTTLCMARDFLKEYFSERSSEPLTPEELALMKGNPIFISGVGEQVLDWEPQYSICSEASRQSVRSSSERGKVYFLYADSYGKTWIAYRRKPREWRPVRPLPYNSPLSLEELRDMHGEVVWFVPLTDEYGDRAPCWITVSYQHYIGYFAKKYGITWLAYYQKPGDEKKEPASKEETET